MADKIKEVQEFNNWAQIQIWYLIVLSKKIKTAQFNRTEIWGLLELPIIRMQKRNCRIWQKNLNRKVLCYNLISHNKISLLNSQESFSPANCLQKKVFLLLFMILVQSRKPLACNCCKAWWAVWFSDWCWSKWPWAGKTWYISFT